MTVCLYHVFRNSGTSDHISARTTWGRYWKVLLHNIIKDGQKLNSDLKSSQWKSDLRGKSNLGFY
jgi:hypothetical protein